MLRIPSTHTRMTPSVRRPSGRRIYLCRVEFKDMGNNVESDQLTPWEALSMQRQLELREAYGHYLDSLPPTCSMETKIERFRRWLEEQGISYST